MPRASQERAAEPTPIVLFLDDNLDILELYEAYFGGNGNSVLTSSEGANAIRIAEANPVTVAVVDYEMPEMKGHEVALAPKCVRPVLPVIMVSGNNSIPRRPCRCGFLRAKRRRPAPLGRGHRYIPPQQLTAPGPRRLASPERSPSLFS